ncbi:MAG: hypothetical protein HYT90_03890 [Candidatus Omnitrophica bacterium]|nr:hypothetical protein [Candidatus Omnitrophota bacterium]
MPMDAAKKTELEKRVVIGLAGLFAVTFFVGPLRGLGLFSRPSRATSAAPAAPVTEKVSMSSPLGAMMRQDWQQQADQQAGAPAEVPPVRAADPPRYTAQHLRDPLKSLLPEEPVALSQQEPPAAAKAGVTPPAAGPRSGSARSDSPPKLEVQGVIWGAPEPQAIINDRVYRLDDMVDGGRIRAISQDGVTVEYQGQSVSYAPSR